MVLVNGYPLFPDIDFANEDEKLKTNYSERYTSPVHG